MKKKQLLKKYLEYKPIANYYSKKNNKESLVYPLYYCFKMYPFYMEHFDEDYSYKKAHTVLIKGLDELIKQEDEKELKNDIKKDIEKIKEDFEWA